MRKYINRIVLVLSIVFLCSTGLRAQSSFEGWVFDDVQRPVPDVNVVEKITGQRASTDSLGKFTFIIPVQSTVISLSFSKIGYKSVDVSFSSSEGPVTVLIESNVMEVEEVQINTGYQWIPRERATGSFVHVKAEELAAIPGRSVINKLDGIMPGLQFDNRNTGPMSDTEPSITVRGMTGFSVAASAPLIVVDNFPYEGNIENINPNDVESITLMRDASATSIWGARAGNGVLVINLKKPDQSGQFSTSWSSNVSVTGKPDLFYPPTMTSSEFVDVEMFLYDQNYYRSALMGSNAYRTVFSPVVQGLYDLETGQIGQSELDRIISDARSHDYRHDMLDHFYRNKVQHNHHFSLSKRTGNHSLRFSAGVDRMEGIGNTAIGKQGDTRYAFTLYNEYHLSDRLSTQLNINYSLYDNQRAGGIQYPINPGGGKTSLYPYARLVDEDGNGLPVPNGLNLNYVDTVAAGMLLDWRYIPMEDRNHTIRESLTSRVSPTFTLRYNPFRSFQLEAIYSGDYQFLRSGTRNTVESFTVRDNVNRYSQIVGEEVIRPFPLGEIYVNGHTALSAHKLRFNAKMDEDMGKKGRLTWIIGGEVSDASNTGVSQRTLGYNDFHTTYIPVDHTVRFPLFLGGTSNITSGHSFSRSVRRLVSFFGNASYSFDNRYVVSGSLRRDASNVFGAKANERWNPLWSVGFAWNVHNERFLKDVDWISNLRIRVTHGHSGNLGGGTTSDRVVIYYSPGQSAYIGLPFAGVSSPPNPHLKWENVQMDNYSVDFSLLKDKIAGSVEYFSKKVTDLISHDPLDPTTGFSFMDRNVAKIDGEGFDVTLNFNPFTGPFKWNMGTSLSLVKDRVTEFYGNLPSTLQIVSSDNTIRPILGKALMPVHSYRFQGLDPLTGDPLGFLNGEVSKDYRRLTRDSLQNLNYHGSARPLYYGFINQNFSYQGFTLFLNFTFRGGHYFKDNTIRYNSLFSEWSTHSDFSKRWQKAGDELTTKIPSLVYPGNNDRDNFYAHSESNVKRGDIIRLQQARISYRFQTSLKNTKNVNLSFQAQNLGIVWKASKGKRDPDYHSIPLVRSFSGSINFQF